MAPPFTGSRTLPYRDPEQYCSTEYHRRRYINWIAGAPSPHQVFQIIPLLACFFVVSLPLRVQYVVEGVVCLYGQCRVFEAEFGMFYVREEVAIFVLATDADALYVLTATV